MEKKLNQLELKKDQLTLKISNLEEEYFRTSSPYVNCFTNWGKPHRRVQFYHQMEAPHQFLSLHLIINKPELPIAPLYH